MRTSRLTSLARRPRAVVVIGAGFIGTHVVEALVNAGVPTRVVTRSAPTRAALDAILGAEVIAGDITQQDVLDAALRDARHVIFCAGGLTPTDSMASPMADLESSLAPLLAVLEALKSTTTGLTYLSSGGTVYGEPQALPIPESHPTRPVVPYGVAKLAAESYIGVYSRVSGRPAVILRCANAYGERQRADRNQGAVAVFMHRLRRGEPLTVTGDGSALRDYVYVRDVARVVASLVESDHSPGVLNLGSGHGTSLRELIALIEDVTGIEAQVEYRPSMPFHVQQSVLDITRLRSLVDFHPTPLRIGLERTWQAVLAEERASLSAHQSLADTVA